MIPTSLDFSGEWANGGPSPFSSCLFPPFFNSIIKTQLSMSFINNVQNNYVTVIQCILSLRKSTIKLLHWRLLIIIRIGACKVCRSNFEILQPIVLLLSFVVQRYNEFYGQIFTKYEERISVSFDAS